LKTLKIRIGSLEFDARLEEEKAPRTCAAFSKLLPLSKQAIQARWSGEAAWVPLGDLQLEVGYENHTSHPAPGQLLFHPGGLSEAEILIPYGSTCFSSRVGQLAGNHFLTMLGTAESLAEIGRLVLWKGAQDVVFGS
jgi:hypothetical protein